MQWAETAIRIRENVAVAKEASQGRVIVHETVFAPTAPPAMLTSDIKALSTAIAPFLAPLPGKEAYPGERLFVPEPAKE